MFNYIWPIALVVFSNVIYQICAKSVPEGMNPLASLTITYLVAAAVSGILYFSLSKDPNLIHEYSKTNWVPFAFGFVLVGLEVGHLCLQSRLAGKRRVDSPKLVPCSRSDSSWLHRVSGSAYMEQDSRDNNMPCGTGSHQLQMI